ncbi:MAG: hypothetical protein R2807_09200 [Chitinophagales bacterium]
MSEQIKFFQNVQTYVDQAAAYTKFSKGLLHQIKACNAVYRINFPVKIKDEIRVIEAYRVQHSHQNAHKRRYSIQRYGGPR